MIDAAMMMKNTISMILLATLAVVLNGCKAVEHLFQMHIWVGIWIIVVIGLLIGGLAIKLFEKNTD